MDTHHPPTGGTPSLGGEAGPEGKSGKGVTHPRAQTIETVPKTLSVAQVEMVQTIKTPEVTAKPIELLPETHKALIDTLTYHFEIIDKLAKRATPYICPTDSLQEMFYKDFKRRFSNKDLNDPAQLQAAAEEFLAKGGAEVRLALKLAEWEAASLQVASGREFKKVKSKVISRIDKKKTIYDLNSKGLKKLERRPGLFELFGEEKITQDSYEMTGGVAITLDPTANTLMNDLQKNFLEEAGWQQGALTEARREILDQRLLSIAQTRTDIFLQTGLNPENIGLNLVQGGHYLGRATAHLLKEQTGVNIRDILQTEGKDIAQEVKDKVQKEIEEKKKETSKRKGERTVDQLQRRITEIKATAGLTDTEKTVKITEIDAEKQRLQKQLELFSRQRLLAGEIADATTASEEAKKKVEAHQSAMVNMIAGESDVDLFKWSGDVSESESCAAIQVQVDVLEQLKAPIDEEIERLRGEIDKHHQRKPSVEGLEIDEYTETAKSGAVKKGMKTPTQQRIDDFDRWQQRLGTLEEQLERKLEELNKDKTQDNSTETLSGKLAKLKAKLTRREAVLADAEMKASLDEYHKAERTLKAKTDEQTDVAAKITPVSETTLNEDDIKKGIKVKEDEKKALEVGGLTGKDKLEVDALSALAVVYTSNNQAKKESRTKEAETGILDLEYGPQWKDYPPAILRCVQLIWGDEVLEAGPANKELADQLMALMRSPAYLDIFITTIESKNSITGRDYVDRVSAYRTSDGSYGYIDRMFVSKYPSLDISKINRDTIETIVEELRRKALNITTTP